MSQKPIYGFIESHQAFWLSSMGCFLLAVGFIPKVLVKIFLLINSPEAVNVYMAGEHRKHSRKKKNLKSLRTDRISSSQYTSAYHTFVGQRRPLVR